MSLSVDQYAGEDTLRALDDACLTAFEAGMLLVASSGNVPTFDGNDQFTGLYPAAFPKRVFAVGAMLPDGQRWRDRNINPGYCDGQGNGQCLASNYGTWLDVLAPGGRFIVTTKNGPDSYYTLDGCNLNDFTTMGF